VALRGGEVLARTVRENFAKTLPPSSGRQARVAWPSAAIEWAAPRRGSPQARSCLKVKSSVDWGWSILTRASRSISTSCLSQSTSPTARISPAENLQYRGMCPAHS